MEKVPMTAGGLVALEEELRQLKFVERHEVIKAIEGLRGELTILIIAHRLTTLKKCDQVVELTQNGIRVGDYNSIIGEQ